MDSANSSFYIKTFGSEDYSQSIILQNENGPCALVALINVLVLTDSPMAEFIHSRKNQQTVIEDEIKLKLGGIATKMNPDSTNLESLFEFLPRLSKGLDVNPVFNGTFARSPELGVFESFNIPLVHGWVLGEQERFELGIEDPQSSNMSYEQLCELQFADKPDPQLGQFLELYPSQMTISGFNLLSESLPEEKYAVLFWNNHFSTITRHNGKIYALVTDLGFQGKSEIVWEEINTSGAGSFFNSKFRPSDEREKLDLALAQQLAADEDNGSNSSTNKNSSSSKQNKNSYIDIREKPENKKPVSTVSSKVSKKTETKDPKNTNSKSSRKSQKNKRCIIV